MTDVADDSIRKAIVEPLVAYNLAQTGRNDVRPLVLAVEDDGAVVGGRGLGTELMARAEAEAIARGCHGAWLDTFEFQARGFYERLGYECFGELKDYPAGSARYFMRKTLGG